MEHSVTIGFTKKIPVEKFLDIMRTLAAMHRDEYEFLARHTGETHDSYEYTLETSTPMGMLNTGMHVGMIYQGLEKKKALEQELEKYEGN